jgi:hypothetical protein
MWEIGYLSAVLEITPYLFLRFGFVCKRREYWQEFKYKTIINLVLAQRFGGVILTFPICLNSYDSNSISCISYLKSIVFKFKRILRTYWGLN